MALDLLLTSERTTIERAIGNTPLVELPTFSPRPGVRLWAKLEGANPSGSVKDRIALAMLDAAEAAGDLQPGTGAHHRRANQRQHRHRAGHARPSPRLPLPGGAARERQRRAAPAAGACTAPRSLFTPAERASNGAIRRAQAARRRASRALLHALPVRQRGESAAPTTRRPRPRCCATCPTITHFVAGLGTGGTLTGAGRRLKETRPSVQVIAAEPHPGEGVQGLRSLDEGFIPPVLDASVLDRKILVTSDDSLVHDPSAGRPGRHLCRHLLGRGAARGAPRRQPAGAGRDRLPLRRRRLEVPQPGRLGSAARRGPGRPSATRPGGSCRAADLAAGAAGRSSCDEARRRRARARHAASWPGRVARSSACSRCGTRPTRSTRSVASFATAPPAWPVPGAPPSTTTWTRATSCASTTRSTHSTWTWWATTTRTRIPKPGPRRPTSAWRRTCRRSTCWSAWKTRASRACAPGAS